MKSTKRPKQGVYARVLVLEMSKDEYIIVYDYQDGTACLVSTHCSDGYLKTEYCRERFTKDFGDLSEELAQGKMYIQDWNGSKKCYPHKTTVDKEVIEDAIRWLCVGQVSIKTHIKKTNDWESAQKRIKSFLSKA